MLQRSHPFHMINVMWGEAFTRLFLDVVLPNTLAPGNLGGFSALDRSVYLIYTTRESGKLLAEHPLMKRLDQMLKLEIHFIDDLFDEDNSPHHILTRCHQMALSRAARDDAAMVWLCPDMVCSEGTFPRLLELFDQGYKAVMVAGLRLKLEEMEPKLVQMARESADGSLALPARELMAMALENLHPIIQNSFWNAQSFTILPSVLFWPVDSRNIVSRCFHLHPILVHPQIAQSDISTTIDGDFVGKAVGDRNLVYFVTDSDDISVCELSPRNHNFPAMGKASTVRVASWAYTGTDKLHRQQVRKLLRFHACEVDPVNWRPVERESSKVVDHILFWLRHPAFLCACQVLTLALSLLLVTAKFGCTLIRGGIPNRSRGLRRLLKKDFLLRTFKRAVAVSLRIFKKAPVTLLRTFKKAVATSLGTFKKLVLKSYRVAGILNVRNYYEPRTDEESFFKPMPVFNQTMIMLNFGQRFLALGFNKLAWASYRYAANSEPNSPEAHEGIGMVASRMGLHFVSAEEFMKAWRLDPSPARLREISRGLAHAGWPEEALAILDEICKAEPENKMALAHRASLKKKISKGRMKDGKIKSEIADYRKKQAVGDS